MIGRRLKVFGNGPIPLNKEFTFPSRFKITFDQGNHAGKKIQLHRTIEL